MFRARFYIIVLFVCAALFSTQQAHACSRLQPSYKTNPNFLKKLTKASRPIQDMLINLDDEKDDDETSSKKSRSKWNRAITVHTYKFNPCLAPSTIYTLRCYNPVAQHHFPTEKFFSAKTPVSIAICCFRI